MTSPSASAAPCGCACSCEPSEKELFAQLDVVINEYHTKPGGLIPALQTAQSIFGYLPETVIRRVADGFGKTVSEVAGVVTFYSFFTLHPRGKYLVRVCLGTACYVRGGKRVLDAIKHKLKIDVGETTPDRNFTLEVARCFGACGLAPAIMIDDDVHHRVKASKIELVLSKYRDAEAPVEQKRSA